jgi:biopolymer transport protein ExbB
MDPQQAAGFTSFLAQTDAVGKAILVVMLAMSIATWYLIATKTIITLLERRRSARFLEAFWDAPSLTALEKHIEVNHPEDPFSHLAWHAISAHRHHLGRQTRSPSGKVAEAASSMRILRASNPASPCSPRSARRRPSWACSAPSGACTTRS